MTAGYNHLLLFDCDGTLVDGQHLIADAMERTFEIHQLPVVSPLAVRDVIGLSLPEAMAKLLPGESIARYMELSETYKNAYRDMHVIAAQKAEPLYEGTAEMLRSYSGSKALLGVATGKSKRGLDRVLSHHGLAELFVTLQTADFHPSKPHPSMVETAMAEAGACPETTIMIGDTSYDMIMGSRAGVHTIGVDWGYHSVAELKSAGANHLISGWQDLWSLAEKIFKGAQK